MHASAVVADEEDLTEALARLELEGGDCLEIKVKTFAEYSRSALGPTLSAFANLPGGGTILLGVSEDLVKYDICTFAADTEERRVIEGLGTGIRAVRDALREADMESVRFHNTGVQFTALLPRSALLSPADLNWLSALDSTGLSVEQRHALVDMRHGRSWTNSTYRRRFGLDLEQARRRTSGDLTGLSSNILTVWASLESGARSRTQIAEATGLTRRQVGYALNQLKAAGLVCVQGGQGSRTTTYQRV